MGTKVTSSVASKALSASGISTVNRSRQDDGVDCTEIRTYLVECFERPICLYPRKPTRGGSCHGTAWFASYEPPIQIQELVPDKCWVPLDIEGYRPLEAEEYRPLEVGGYHPLEGWGYRPLTVTGGVSRRGMAWFASSELPVQIGGYRWQDFALLERVRAFQNIHG